MKKILFVCGFLVAGFLIGSLSSYAPAPVSNPCVGGSYYTNPAAFFPTPPLYPAVGGKLDTVTNTGTDSFKCVVGCNATCVTFQENFTKISGTFGGTVTYYASLDGTNYTAIGSAYTVTTAAAQSTLFLVNAGVRNPYIYYMIVWVGTGTMSGSWQGFVTVRT